MVSDRPSIIDVLRMGGGVRSSFRELELWVAEVGGRVHRISLTVYRNGSSVHGSLSMRWVCIVASYASFLSMSRHRAGTRIYLSHLMALY